MGLFQDRTKSNGKTTVPVWFMRQAGRYHGHYQNIKKNSDFMSMCKTPELACEVTMGPIEDFNFDAAILFSDLLFPLEQLGMGLNYLQGPPQLGFQLNSLDALKRLKKIAEAEKFYDFQKQALQLLKKRLPQNVSLLGFVGAPFTLYTYAVEGSHAGGLTSSKRGLYEGRFERFCEMLIPELLTEMSVQAQGGADAVCLFDTAAGELTFDDYKRFSIPVLKQVTKEFKARFPKQKIIYYSKMTHLKYLQALEDKNIDVLGVDWRMDLTEALKVLGPDYMVQGNLDPAYLHLPWPNLKEKLDELWNAAQASKMNLDRWVMGLGHGVLQHTPEENVRNTVAYVHEHFRY